MYERLGYEHADVLTLGKRLIEDEITEFHPGDYDVHGRLRLPFVLVRSAVAGPLPGVFVMAGRRAAGRYVTESLYPDHVRSG